ncbi:MAG: hypothetical protein JWR32_4259 [Mycobacterium sp.]|jgi:hypothetical protein|nr:hypothetical protein [Mycobacterium sp.]
MRLPVSLAGLLTAAVLLAGCAHPIHGRAVAAPVHVGKSLSGADLDSVLLSPSQISDMVGAKLAPHTDVGRPVRGDPAQGPCAALDSAGMQPFIGDGFGAFHLLLLSDGIPTEHDHVVTQAAAVYPDSASATKVFTTAAASVAPCNGKELKTEAAWRFAVNDITSDAVRWNKEQTDLPILWVCYGQSRVRANAILQAMSCQGDDGGQANADAILNKMSATVWELSGA